MLTIHQIHINFPQFVVKIAPVCLILLFAAELKLSSGGSPYLWFSCRVLFIGLNFLLERFLAFQLSFVTGFIPNHYFRSNFGNVLQAYPAVFYGSIRDVLDPPAVLCSPRQTLHLSILSLDFYYVNLKSIRRWPMSNNVHRSHGHRLLFCVSSIILISFMAVNWKVQFAIIVEIAFSFTVQLRHGQLPVRL